MLNYYSGQGRVLLATRNASGMPNAFRFLGDVAPLESSVETERTQHRESTSGQRGLALDIEKALTANVSMTLHQQDAANLRLITRGEDVAQASGSLSATNISPATGTLAVGDSFMLPGFGLTSVVITDSTGSPKTLTPDVNYVLDPSGSHIDIIDVTTGGPFALALKVAATKPASSSVKMFAAAAQEYWLRFIGVNTAVPGSPTQIVDFYRWRPSPASLALINEEKAEYPIEGGLLVDSTKLVSSEFGQYGRIWTPSS